MKIDGLDWIDWLHKIRADSEAERKRRGISGAEWLEMVVAEVKEIRKRYGLDHKPERDVNLVDRVAEP